MEDRERHATTARLLTHSGPGVAAAAALCLLWPAQAWAGPPLGGGCSGAGKWVVCEADNDSSTSGSGAEPADAGSGKNTDTKPVCTTRKLDPQPPEGSMYWKDQSPKDGGAVYERSCLTGEGGTPVYTYFVADDAADGPAVDPLEVAQLAVSKMKLVGPDIASPRPAGRYIVGVPMWMWVNQTPTTFGPNSTSASAGGVTVTATAKVTKVVWVMGDGASVTCHGAGMKYVASYGKQESPTCGHVYSRHSAPQPHGKYTVTATSTWTVDWQVAGGAEAGQFAETRQSQMQVGIGELQVVR
ncbi:ATP/GTP-binding protein [Streptomyces sp. NPDC003011]